MMGRGFMRFKPRTVIVALSSGTVARIRLASSNKSLAALGSEKGMWSRAAKSRPIRTWRRRMPAVMFDASEWAVWCPSRPNEA